MTESYTIEIGCPPGYPRPGDLLPKVLEGTGVTIDPENTIARSFGDWEWKVPEDQSEQYEKARDTIKERLDRLYNSGVIRYASW